MSHIRSLLISFRLRFYRDFQHSANPALCIHLGDRGDRGHRGEVKRCKISGIKPGREKVPGLIPRQSTARRAGQPVPLSNIIGGDLQMMSDFSISPRIYKGLVDIIRFAKYCRFCVQDIGAGT